ncbi:uncharacterized protein LACBIDRAFT_325872 [Laccaria bicolor S238N-H82]|uniref:Predicted protein n=1 Tax=Laccaria bicolor (strain S238N-H82 / ATCC MYA-4686) TaxID=486041 RepID=B0D6I6_LACBS|nr:uncharacterized protein LACBIDRAFT_325872 [Laccaria bicolor S238N-H82]EDR09961.1 predicted protein [Laccaria bicolor S238N-H82]|eukprot:XP_001879346.1 predicted protein [Laccaria bicolor S238N-H82]
MPGLAFAPLVHSLPSLPLLELLTMTLFPLSLSLSLLPQEPPIRRRPELKEPKAKLVLPGGSSRSCRPAGVFKSDGNPLAAAGRAVYGPFIGLDVEEGRSRYEVLQAVDALTGEICILRPDERTVPLITPGSLNAMPVTLRCLVLPTDDPESSSFVTRIDGDHLVHHSNGTKIIESVRLDGTDVRISRIKGDCLVSQLSIAGSYLHILAQTPGGLAVHTSTDIHSALEEDSGHLRNELVLPGRKDALWKKDEAWTKIARVVEGRVPNPSALGEAQEFDLYSPDEVKVTTIDLVYLLKWTPDDAIWSPIPIFLVRGEYTELEIFSASQSQHVLLLGQPGIGKTVYLMYSLLRRLIAGLPTIFAKSPINRYIFLDSGVYWIPHDSFAMS